MLNKEKIRTMSKIAVMEKHHGEELQKARENIIAVIMWRVQLLKNACYLTVAYMIGLLLWGVANMDMLIEKLNRMQIKGILTGVIVSYLLCDRRSAAYLCDNYESGIFTGRSCSGTIRCCCRRLEDEDDIEILEVTDLRRKSEGNL